LVLLLLWCEHQDFLIRRKLTIVIIRSRKRRGKKKKIDWNKKYATIDGSHSTIEKKKRKITFIRLSMKMDRNKKKTRKGALWKINKNLFLLVYFYKEKKILFLLVIYTFYLWSPNDIGDNQGSIYFFFLDILYQFYKNAKAW